MRASRRSKPVLLAIVAVVFAALAYIVADKAYGDRGIAYYRLGDLKSARDSCETKPDYWGSQQCLAVIYDKLGRHADAEAERAKMKTALGDTSAYQYATIYAQ